VQDQLKEEDYGDEEDEMPDPNADYEAEA